MPENNGKQNSEQSYTKKYQNDIACSYRHKLVCVDEKFSKPFKHTNVEFLSTILLTARKNCRQVIKIF